MKTKTMTIGVLIAAVVLGAAALAYSELSGPGEPAPTTPTPTPITAAGTEHDPDHDHDHDHDHDELVPAPTSTPDLPAVAAAAVDALTAYAQRDLGYTDWFAQLEPHLHTSAVDAYATVQPSGIPAIAVEGEAITTETSTDTYAVVYVPTSIGRYTVELRRTDPTSSWGATRFQPPAS